MKRSKLDEWMTKLAYSRVLTERFQKWHLITNYSLLALGCVVYLLGAPVMVIAIASWPGAIIFLISVEALSYRKAIEGGSMQELLEGFLPR
jgi:hypothetical protein